MKSERLVGVVMCGILLGVAVNAVQGATLRYRESGDWQNLNTDGSSVGWSDNANVNLPWNSMPTTADLGRINYNDNTVTVTTTETLGRVQVGVDQKGNLVIANGGSLTTVAGNGQNGDVTIGQGNNVAGTGTMFVQSGGTLNVGNILFHGNIANGTSDIAGTATVASHLWTGWTAGATGIINVNDGGILNVSGQLGLNWNDNGAIGLLNINNGGTVNLSQIHSTGNSIRGDSLLTIAGTGMLTKTGNFVSVINTQYIDTGKIVGAGGVELIVTHDAGLNLTTVAIIPEPGSLMLLALAGLGLLARRRRHVD